MTYTTRTCERCNQPYQKIRHKGTDHCMLCRPVIQKEREKVRKALKGKKGANKKAREEFVNNTGRIIMSHHTPKLISRDEVAKKTEEYLKHNDINYCRDADSEFVINMDRLDKDGYDELIMDEGDLYEYLRKQDQ